MNMYFKPTGNFFFSILDEEIPGDNVIIMKATATMQDDDKGYVALSLDLSASGLSAQPELYRRLFPHQCHRCPTVFRGYGYPYSNLRFSAPDPDRDVRSTLSQSL
jgi:hypothetical protein